MCACLYISVHTQTNMHSMGWDYLCMCICVCELNNAHSENKIKNNTINHLVQSVSSP